MQRQRGELVPIGEAFSDLPGPVQALIPSRPTQRHYTRFDQVNQLVSASEADPNRGFMARMMVLCSLAAQQSRQPSSVQARQRPLHAPHGRGLWQQAPLRQPAAPVAGLGFRARGIADRPHAVQIGIRDIRQILNLFAV